jgi:tRNA modification GTPase
VVLNKIDLIGAERSRVAEGTFNRPGRSVFAISAAEGTGVEPLIAALSRHAADFFFNAGEPALVTRERHRHALGETLAALRRSLAEAVSGREEIVAEELRLAARALGRLTGRVDVEDVLDVIFRDFCIGK